MVNNCLYSWDIHQTQPVPDISVCRPLALFFNQVEVLVILFNHTQEYDT